MSLSGAEAQLRGAGHVPETGADRPLVCTQGLGFVGSAMAIAVANALDPDGSPCFDVAGIELSTPDGEAKVQAINAGRVPVATTDEKLSAALDAAHRRGNLFATTDERMYRSASVAIVDVPLDVTHTDDGPTVSFDAFRRAIRTLGEHMPPGSLIMVETTVPPGTCERVVVPELADALAARGLPPDALLVSHSYERVMPGEATSTRSSTSGAATPATHREAADACEAFLSRVINVEEYPLTRLHSTTACETAKVIENSYRATTIALMEEWGRFAETVGVDLFEVIVDHPACGRRIRICVSRASASAATASRRIRCLRQARRPAALRPRRRRLSVLHAGGRDQRRMPLVSLRMLDAPTRRQLTGKNILLLGVSYRQDVADTRYSPSEVVRPRRTRARGVRRVPRPAGDGLARARAHGGE